MILLDAKATMYHAYHIGEDPDAISTALDNNINTAAYGFNQWMERYMLPILNMHAPIDIIACHDGGTDYRTAILPEYKQTKSRVERDPEQKVQTDIMLKMIKNFLAAIGATQAYVEGVEADDILAYFCQTMKDPILIYTVDQDILQLQGQYDHVQVLLKCEYQDTGECNGIPHKFTSLAKSMLGDSSDNYKGVTGFGPKKWDRLVDTIGYDGIEEIEQCVKTNQYDDIREALECEPNQALQLLYDNREEWRVGYRLAILHPELCWKPRNKKLTKIQWFKRLPDGAKVKNIFNAMGCSDLIADEAISKYLPECFPIIAEDVDDDLFTQFEAACLESPIVSFDYETYPSENAMLVGADGKDYVDVKEALIAGVSFTYGTNLQSTIYIPVNHNSDGNVRVEVIGKLLKIAERCSKLVVQNAFFEIAVTLTNLDFWLGRVVDTALMASYVDENETTGLKDSSKRELAHTQASYAETVADPVTGEMRTMDQLSLDEVFSYGCDDATCTAHLWVLRNIIMQIEGTLDFFMENQTLSQHALVDAYLTGCEIDWDALEVQHQKDLKTIEVKMAEMRNLLSENCASTQPGGGSSLVKSETDYIKAKAYDTATKKLIKDGIDTTSEEGMQVLAAAKKQAVAKYSEECLAASAYTTYETTEEPPEFLPTAGQFKALTEKLEFEPPLEKVSRKAISEWLAEVTQIDVDDDHDDRAELTKDQALFTTLLARAADDLKSREGDQYQHLMAFCVRHSGVQGKVTSTGDELNTGSSKQMQQLLYCKLNLPVRNCGFPTKGSFRDVSGLQGSPQTDALAIQTALAEDTQAEEDAWKKSILEALLEVKEASTRCSFYHDSYPGWKHPTDGRMHPQIRDCGTVTRRPSATKPNILAVSKHQQEGVMRSIYVPYGEDELIVSIDFKQQELCITASESGDKNLISCYVGDNKRDVHSMTAAGIAKTTYEKYIEAYDDDEHEDHGKYVKIRKRPAKQTNFLMTYLGEAPTLSRKLIIPLKDAEAMMNAAYATYPRIQPWQDEVVSFARTHGYARTAYGSRRHVTSNIFAKSNSVRKRMERQAVNSVIQGCAADILKIVLTQCWETNLWRDTGAKLLGPVYDEITSSVPISMIPEYIHRLVEIMTLTPPGHIVPMAADVSLGHNWRDQIEIGENPTDEVILEAIEKAVEARDEASVLVGDVVVKA